MFTTFHICILPVIFRLLCYSSFYVPYLDATRHSSLPFAVFQLTPYYERWLCSITYLSSLPCIVTTFIYSYHWYFVWSIAIQFTSYITLPLFIVPCQFPCYIGIFPIKNAWFVITYHSFLLCMFTAFLIFIPLVIFLLLSLL